MATINKNGVTVGELFAHTDTFGNPAWDAHAINPLTGEKKLVGTFVKPRGQAGMDVLKDAEKAVKAYKWPVTMKKREHESFGDRMTALLWYNGAEVGFVFRDRELDANGADASVYMSYTHTIKATCEIVKYFIDQHPEVNKIVNQVHREQELKAFWNAGFFHGELRKWDDHVEALRKRGSIMLTWERYGAFKRK